MVVIHLVRPLPPMPEPPMPHLNPKFSFSIAGRWTKVQADAVLASLREEADAQGVELFLIDVTSHSDECRWFLISPRRKREDVYSGR